MSWKTAAGAGRRCNIGDSNNNKNNNTKWWYAVRVGHTPGVYESWPKAREQVQGFTGAVYKKFETLAKAQKFADVQPQNRHGRSGEEEQEEDGDGESSARAVTVYTDGSFMRGVAGYGLCYEADEEDPRNVSALLPGSQQTNQRAELYAILTALYRHKKTEPSDSTLLIVSDSTYSIQCCRDWMERWMWYDWTSSRGGPVLNTDILFRLADLLYGGRGPRHILPSDDGAAASRLKDRVSWRWVKGHSGDRGNDEADRLATQAVRRELERLRADKDGGDDSDGQDESSSSSQ